ncbi:SpdD protein [Streptomyces sp. F63]|uniref:SpdD protein n=1 Tax=Streptomyces sp. F63 TaxID=2824887 RepID=UPI001B376497|nr:SpdD protein [Streptomyces sp. F63]MBQ0983063.1 SpdD protein [Streptomyces sp. F63]
MLQPRLPDPPPVPHVITSATTTGQRHDAPAACSCTHAPAPSAGRPVAPFVGIGAGAIAAVLVVGVVLTALLATVAVTAVAVSIAALVLRSLLNGANRR